MGECSMGWGSRKCSTAIKKHELWGQVPGLKLWVSQL